MNEREVYNLPLVCPLLRGSALEKFPHGNGSKEPQILNGQETHDLSGSFWAGGQPAPLDRLPLPLPNTGRGFLLL